MHNETHSVEPIPTGDGNAFDNNNAIYFAEIELFTPIILNEGETYWLSPIGMIDSLTWQWQLHDGTLRAHRARGGTGGPDWRSQSETSGEPLVGNFAFRLHAIPEPSILALLGLCAVACGFRRTRR